MAGFFSSLFTEIAARRRRMRAALGERAQGFVEFLVLGGLLVGSLGLFVREWMPAAAPWGLALPFLFLAGYVLIDVRRQASMRLAEAEFARQAEQARAVARGEGRDMPMVKDEEGRTIVDRTAISYDWTTLLWSFGCSLAGAAAFVIAWTGQPPPAQQEDVWAPPESSVSVDISP